MEVNRGKRILNSREGTTLVELIVAFLLTAILMTAAIACISPAMKVFYKVITMSHAQGITDILLEEMSGELESADRITSIGTSGVLKYVDKNGQGVTLETGGDDRKDDGETLRGMLVLTYAQEKEDINWYLPRKTYMGFEITDLEFTQIEDRNLIEIRLVVRNGKNGATHERTKIVECYKLGDGAMTQ